MSLLGRVEGHALSDGSEKTFDVLSQNPSAFMPDSGAASDARCPAPLEAHQDARAVVRLVQCPRCSKPFQTPVTLPCGHSVCRACLPSPQRREGISYPNTSDRTHSIQCPLPDCGAEHPTGECNVDVTLSKVMDAVKEVVDNYSLEEDKAQTSLEIESSWPATSLSEKAEVPQSRAKIMGGGRLYATFKLAQQGELPFDARVTYRPVSGAKVSPRDLDSTLLDRLREATHKELECHVCYNAMLDPLTTPCGHSFCRRCLSRALDHSQYCPFCRRHLPIPPSLQNQPSNGVLSALLIKLSPELVAARAEAVAQEEQDSPSDSSLPLFVCTLSFPAMPTFLHIFEPRYRLMIRRALDGNRKFGMVMYNRGHLNRAEHLRHAEFAEYGTVLEIVNIQMLPDGRSFVETRGVSRFRVRASRARDGYLMGDVERVEDISLAEEEQREAEEVRASVAALTRAAEQGGGGSSTTDPALLAQRQLGALSTRELLLKGVAFIERMRANSAPWLNRRIVDAYGGPPDDPALFPYWFASVLPLAEEEKYLLLRTTSVRERLKMVNSWIRRIEGQRW